MKQVFLFLSEGTLFSIIGKFFELAYDIKNIFMRRFGAETGNALDYCSSRSIR